MSKYNTKAPENWGYLCYVLYQIGIRCLAATSVYVQFKAILLYQIGIRCLASTIAQEKMAKATLYQIGIRCLAATELKEKEKLY